MNTPLVRCVRNFALFALLALLATGCASRAVKPSGDLVLEAPKPSPGVTVQEYKYVTRLGSHIPMRVPKDGNIKPAPGASPVEYLSGEVLTDLVNRPASGRR